MDINAILTKLMQAKPAQTQAQSQIPPNRFDLQAAYDPSSMGSLGSKGGTGPGTGLLGMFGKKG